MLVNQINRYLQERLRQKQFGKNEEPKPKKWLKQRTKKQAKKMKKLGDLYGPYLDKNPVCAIQSPVCTYHAGTVNHKAGRIGENAFDELTWEPSCSPCNIWIEANDKWAQDNGHKISRHTKK